MNIFHFVKSSHAKQLIVLNCCLYRSGDLSLLTLDDATWFVLATGHINFRTKKHAYYREYKEVLCGRPTTRDVAIGPKEEINTSDGHWVVQRAERQTVYPRFAKPMVDERSFYLIHEHPFTASATSVLNRQEEGVVGNNPIEAIDSFHGLMEIIRQMQQEIKHPFPQKPE